MAPSRGGTNTTSMDALLSTTPCLDPTPSRPIPVLSSSTSYSLFRSQHLLPNTPCLFPSSQTSRWSLFSRWIKTETGELDWKYLEAKYGELEVECVECEGEGERTGRGDDEEEEEETLDRFSDLLSLWKEGRGQRIYLKDWHLPLCVAQSVGSSIAAGREKVREELYEVDECWLDDWMNEWEGAGRGKGAEASTEGSAAGGRKEDDFRFVYAGGGESWTGLHRDVCAFSRFQGFLSFSSSPLPVPLSSLARFRLASFPLTDHLHHCRLLLLNLDEPLRPQTLVPLPSRPHSAPQTPHHGRRARREKRQLRLVE